MNSSSLLIVLVMIYLSKKKIYAMLLYGIPVKEDVETNYITIHLIDWKNRVNNDFAIA